MAERVQPDLWRAFRGWRSWNRRGLLNLLALITPHDVPGPLLNDGFKTVYFMNVCLCQLAERLVLGLDNGGSAPSAGRQGALWPTGTEPPWVRGHRQEMVEAFQPAACLLFEQKNV